MKPNNYYLHLIIKRKAIKLEIMKLIFITWHIRLVWNIIHYQIKILFCMMLMYLFRLFSLFVWFPCKRCNTGTMSMNFMSVMHLKQTGNFGLHGNCSCHVYVTLDLQYNVIIEYQSKMNNMDTHIVNLPIITTVQEVNSHINSNIANQQQHSRQTATQQTNGSINSNIANQQQHSRQTVASTATQQTNSSINSNIDNQSNITDKQQHSRQTVASTATQ